MLLTALFHTACLSTPALSATLLRVEHTFSHFKLVLCLITRTTSVKAETLDSLSSGFVFVMAFHKGFHKAEADTLTWLGSDTCLWFLFLLVCLYVWKAWRLLHTELPFYSTRPLLPLPHWWQSPRWWPRQPGCPRSPWLPQLLPPPEWGTHRAFLP